MTPNPFPFPLGRRVPEPATPSPPPLAPMAYLCPRCLAVTPFTQVTTPDGEKYWHCTSPDCLEQRQAGAEANIPFRYTERYDAFPPVPFCLMGGTAQGKTRFLVALFDQLEKAATRWPGFYADPLDTLQFDQLQARMQDYLTGQEEFGSQFADIPEPMVIRYSGIPRVGGCQVIYFDNAGEAFYESSATFRRTNGFLTRSPAVVWTVSLRERDTSSDDSDRLADVRPYDLERVLNNYTTAMATLGGGPQHHTLVLTLTKGERLVPLAGFPESATRLLQDDLLDSAADPWGKLERVSADLTAWLATTRYGGLLNRLRATFKVVRVCVVSAQGREFDVNAPPREFEPKAVLAPLFWLWRTDRPAVTVERNGTGSVYLSVAEAFAAGIPPGSVVRLGPGEHRVDHPLRVQGPVSILGESPEQTFLIGTGGRPGEEFVLGIGGTGEVRLSNLTMERRGAVSGDVVRMMGGKLLAERVRFRGGREVDEKSQIGCGLVIGRGASGTLRQCVFQDNARSGLWVFTTTTDQVVAAECVGRNNRTGLFVTGAGKVRTDNCRWDGNRYGVRLTDQGQLTARGGGAANNRKDGVQASGDSRLSLDDFSSTGNTQNGVEFQVAAGGTLSGGRFTNNTTGVQVGGQCRVEIDKAEVSDNRGDGLVFNEQSGGAVTGGTIAGNDGYGFALNAGVTVDCKDVRTAGNRSGHWKVAKTVPKFTRVVNCGTGRDDRPRGIFG